MVEVSAEASVESQLKDIVEGLQELTRAVVASRGDIAVLKNQLHQVEVRIDQNNIQNAKENVIANREEESAAAPQGNINPQLIQNERVSGQDLPNPEFLVNADSVCKLYDLPLFSGNADEWPLFIANFKDTTDAFKYSFRQNLMRLQKCLCGPAREAVSSMLIYPNDVPKVIEELEFRFGRPDILVRSQLNKVKLFPNITKRKMEQVITFSSMVRNVVAFLTSAGCQQHLMSPTLLEEMISKLPIEQQFEWTKVAANIRPFPNVGDFSTWLADLAKVISMMPNNSNPITQQTNQMMVLDKSKNPKSRCDICSGEHAVAKCKRFAEEMSLSSRWKNAKQLKLCFCCLYKGHSSNKCRFKKVCGINNCKLYHHKTLHDETDLPEANASNQLLNCRHQQLQASKLFKILPVKLSGPSGSLTVYAMFDEGSSLSLIEENTARLLGLKGKSSNLTLQWYGEKVVKEKSFLVNCEIEGVGSGTAKYSLRNLHTVKSLNLPQQSFFKSHHPELSTLPINDYMNVTPMLLLGLDNAILGVPSTVQQAGCLIAMQCKLGWLTYGTIGNDSDQPIVLHIREDDLSNIVQEFLATENFGVNPSLPPLLSVEEQIAKDILEKTTKRIGNRFETGLLWKSFPPKMPPSYEMAYKRLEATERKMSHDVHYAERYKNEIRKYIEKGYAQELSSEEVSNKNSPVWYLPHFGVVNPQKPEKLRVVFDAAAKSSGASLNSFLLKGPEQVKPLLEILLKFREGNIAVAADIREMFSQVKIRKEDQHSQRFLWRNGDTKQPIKHYAMTSMTFGAICSPCSAEYVKNINAEEYAHEYPEACAAILEKHYVDDFVASFQTEDEAIKISQQVVKIHSMAGFELRGFISNSQNLEEIMNGQSSPSMEEVNMEKQILTSKILGMYWNKSRDVFEFKTKFHSLPQEVLVGERPPTKRELLKITMSVFDPYGLIADFLLYSKTLVQETWKFKIDWDDPIPNHIYNKWDMWWKEFKNIECFHIKRCLSPTLSTMKVQLHVFVDASQEAYAAVCYFKIGNDISFVMGKIRCAPLKHMSIPRLELQAAVLGARLSKAVVDGHECEITSVTFWSDSQTVLQWINSSNRRFKSFVSHRIAEILNLSQPNQWRYVPTNQNPADSGTRTVYPPKFTNESLWIKGPEFLRENESYWPPKNIVLCNPSLEEEIKPNYLISTNQKDSLVNYQKFSSYIKLKRTVAWILRFAKLAPKKTTYLIATEIDQADREICKWVQLEHFSDEINCLRHGKPISKRSSIYKLVPYLDVDGLLRVKGRLDEALYLPYGARRPIILPHSHWVSQLIMTHYHIKNHHQNMCLTINELRQRYWIPRIKTLYNRVRRNCSVCRMDAAKPTIPQMGQLPPDRITPYVRPFTYTGVDLCGPFNVSIGRRREKRWAVVFTCLTVRAAHIELAHDLSTDALILCLRNFINRRGIPIRLRSDNGTNFIGAQKLLKRHERLIDIDRINDEVANKNIEWIFNCPENPSSGGAWERLIRIIKRILSKTLQNDAPRLETLNSLLIEAENIINSRPLTEIQLSSEDDEPLTPNHFLLGCLNSTQTPTSSEENLCLRKQWRIAQNLKDRFWRQWVTEFLPQLLQISKWRDKSKPVKIDDFVIIVDATMPRSQWLKGRIIKVFPAKDGQVRSAEVKTSCGIKRRPVSKLAVFATNDGESA
ncbi:uncharacterized protein LOC142224719 [Haematobia irritans]|uniref:uncharacterized protein LOC142224719 n=1 Tax=Haematobia irritans TaxID=7368 RepID=UPI003F4F43A5